MPAAQNANPKAARTRLFYRFDLAHANRGFKFAALAGAGLRAGRAKLQRKLNRLAGRFE